MQDKASGGRTGQLLGLNATNTYKEKSPVLLGEGGRFLMCLQPLTKAQTLV
jgi:hypothetical protein